MHADDTTLALKDINSLNIAIKTVEYFCKHAASKVNLSKTQCILLECLKNKYTTVGGIAVTYDAVRCFGIYIGHNKTQLNSFKTSDDSKNYLNLGRKENLQFLVKLFRNITTNL